VCRARNCAIVWESGKRGNMSPAIAKQLEKRLEDTGTLHLGPNRAMALFDYRARRLVKMSGKDALKRIRAGKCGQNPAWMELTAFAALL